MTEQDRKEIQDRYRKESGEEVINTQGEFDIDYVSWLESLVDSDCISNVRISFPDNRISQEANDHSIDYTLDLTEQGIFEDGFEKGAEWVRDYINKA
jgi:hypothetical protein